LRINFKCTLHHSVVICAWRLHFCTCGVRIMPKKAKNFDELLMEAIDDALSSLGESVKQSIYFHIENKFVARNEIPKKIQNFQGGLEKIFGAGAQFIEILIMKKLHAKIGITVTIESVDDQLEFIKYVNAAKQSFLEKHS